MESAAVIDSILLEK